MTAYENISYPMSACDDGKPKPIGTFLFSGHFKGLDEVVNDPNILKQPQFPTGKHSKRWRPSSLLPIAEKDSSSNADHRSSALVRKCPQLFGMRHFGGFCPLPCPSPHWSSQHMQRLLLAGLCALAALPALALEKKVPNNWAILESSTDGIVFLNLSDIRNPEK